MTEEQTAKKSVGRPPKEKPKVSVHDLDPRPDIFKVYDADPDKVYFHARDDALRIRELEHQGYTVCDGKEVIGNPELSISNKAGSGPLNVPGHVLMSTSRENWERLQSIKDARLKRHEQDVKDKVDNAKAILERQGLGRARARLKSDEFEI